MTATLQCSVCGERTGTPWLEWATLRVICWACTNIRYNWRPENVAHRITLALPHR